MSARNPTNTSNGLESADELSGKSPELHNMLEKFSQSFIKYSLSVSKSLQPTPCHGEEDYEVIHYERSPPPSPTSSTFPFHFRKSCCLNAAENRSSGRQKQRINSRCQTRCFVCARDFTRASRCPRKNYYPSS